MLEVELRAGFHRDSDRLFQRLSILGVDVIEVCVERYLEVARTEAEDLRCAGGPSRILGPHVPVADCDARVGERDLEPLLGAAQPFGGAHELRHVQACAEQLALSTLGPGRHLPPGTQVAELAVRPHDALFEREGLSIPQGLFDRLLNALSVLRVDAREIVLERGLEQPGVEAINSEELRGPGDPVLVDVPHPVPEMGHALCLRHDHGVSPAQCLGSFELGDVASDQREIAALRRSRVVPEQPLGDGDLGRVRAHEGGFAAPRPRALGDEHRGTGEQGTRGQRVQSDETHAGEVGVVPDAEQISPGAVDVCERALGVADRHQVRRGLDDRG